MEKISTPNYQISHKPHFDNLTEIEKRILLRPLLDVIRTEVRSEEGQKKFQKWKMDLTGSHIVWYGEPLDVYLILFREEFMTSYPKFRIGDKVRYVDTRLYSIAGISTDASGKSFIYKLREEYEIHGREVSASTMRALESEITATSQELAEPRKEDDRKTL